MPTYSVVPYSFEVGDHTGRILPLKGGLVEVLSEIGARIRAERRRHQLTQEQLAEMVGASTRTVRDIEHGTGSTSIGTVAAVAGAVGLTLQVTP
ncbi:helix-turn-helix domain-containing protein [Nocardia neocaledoniensis]|uniref:helix-turn-helix domain-containing protein n=1 Tax=Nocardia neocaledoniensis TaxID=236511 RepID=UPI002456C933|nr:helix-turn-helix domain-containing protein [Nocardia neocaledoniensis]